MYLTTEVDPSVTDRRVKSFCPVNGWYPYFDLKKPPSVIRIKVGDSGSSNDPEKYVRKTGRKYKT